MKKILFTSIALGSFFLISNSNAAMINFDFTNDGAGSNPSAQEFTSEDGSLALTANAQWKYDNGSTWYNPVNLSWGGSGLYIGWEGDDTHEIDGNQYDERVVFSFSTFGLDLSCRFSANNGTACFV